MLLKIINQLTWRIERSDNLRIINLSLREAELTGQPVYIVALDAKKAFDSVRHSFIHKILI